MENILSIEQIFKPGNSIQLIFTECKGQIQSFTATVKNFIEEGLYIITEEETIDNLLDTGVEMIIQYESPDGIKYLFNTYKIAKIMKNASTLICARPWKMSSSLQYRYLGPQVDTPWKVRSTSLRRYFRIKIDLPFYYILDDIIHVGRIMDLSLGGLFAVVLPDPRLILQHQLTFQLQLPKTEPFELLGEIVRSQTIENTKLGIAINFLDVPDEKRQAIAACLQEF
ncbi:MAG TPA: hypothetical protein DDW50_18625 [Firmicutes bacterium]|nr:hypothetical protein [Bacillota bacterium]